jgi:hypothetical protein
MFIKQNMQICMIKKITACLFEYEKYASRVRTSRQSLVAIYFFFGNRQRTMVTQTQHIFVILEQTYMDCTIIKSRKNEHGLSSFQKKTNSIVLLLAAY